MLETFINKIHMIDPDLIIGHNLCGSVIEILLNRIGLLKINHWSRLGRMKRNSMPQRKNDGTISSWVPRQVSCGRLLVDTFLCAKELIRETNYELKYLCKQQRIIGEDKDLKDYDDEMLPKLYRTSPGIIELCHIAEKYAFFTFKLMHHLQIVPLTKQLTSIAGNLWFRSLQNARAERNEWLLMHEFFSKKFLCPDKKQLNAKEAKKSLFDDGDDEPVASKKGPKRGKAKYGGGLVLEPKAGFYDAIILLLDFNSLYPSIIQEFNLCFTTVNRRHTKNYDGSQIVHLAAQQDSQEGDGFDAEDAQLPEKTGTSKKDAILPNVLRNLVQRRKIVKD